MALDLRIPAEVRAPGVACIPSRTLQDGVRYMPDADLTVEGQERNLQLLWGQSQMTLTGVNPDQFPALPDMSNPTSALTIGTVTLRRLLQRCVWAMAERNYYRPHLASIHLAAKHGRLRAVATNSVCIGWAAAGGEDAHYPDIRATIPASAVAELLRTLGLFGSEVQITTTDTHVLFHRGPVRLYARFPEEPYPDIFRLVPQRYDTEVTVDREALIGTLRRLGAVTRDGAIRLKVTADGLICEAQSEDIGAASERVSAELIGPELKIGFNARYLVKALASWDCRQVKWEFADPRGPARFLPVDTDEDYGAVVLPLISY